MLNYNLWHFQFLHLWKGLGNVQKEENFIWPGSLQICPKHSLEIKAFTCKCCHTSKDRTGFWEKNIGRALTLICG